MRGFRHHQAPARRLLTGCGHPESRGGSAIVRDTTIANEGGGAEGDEYFGPSVRPTVATRPERFGRRAARRVDSGLQREPAATAGAHAGRRRDLDRSSLARSLEAAHGRP